MKAKFIFGILLIQFILIMDSTAQSLDQHQWQDRLLLVFSPDDQDPKLKKQLAILESEKAELKERRMVIYIVMPDRVSTIDNEVSEDKNLANKIRKEFKVQKQTFTTILVGLDGGEKLRRLDTIELHELFGIIDQMPMRKNEIKKKKQN